MRTVTVSITLVVVIGIAAVVYAGEGFHMKCQAESCGYESQVTFGGGMFYEQITGYCRKCKKFISVSWTRDGIPAEMKERVKDQPRPDPPGEVWDAQTGKVLTIHACPTCKGPFLEIKTSQDLKYCPACNKPHFEVDDTKPRIAVD